MHKGSGNAAKFSLSLRNLHLSGVKLGRGHSSARPDPAWSCHFPLKQGKKKHQRSQQGFSVELVGGRSLLSRALSHTQSSVSLHLPEIGIILGTAAAPGLSVLTHLGSGGGKKKLPPPTKKIKSPRDSQGCSWSKVCSYRNCRELRKERQLPNAK